ncbi:MAG: hypothetical protein RML92_09215, partial [Bacteroidia bacterium]|nr:hypothetical protein [Bacteroidia bacterium]MDW8417713.1 hypothetical protein [Bacteroidia bacterium]
MYSYAEDFCEAFGTKDKDQPEEARRYLAESDVAGVALVGVQALVDKQDELSRLVQQLLQQVQSLRSGESESAQLVRGDVCGSDGGGVGSW